MIKKTFGIVAFIFLFSFFIFPKLSLADVNLTASNLKSTSVTLTATGLLPAGRDVVLKLRSSGSTKDYLRTSPGTSDNGGVYVSSFSELSPSSTYIGTVSYPASLLTGGYTEDLKDINITTPVAQSSDKSITNFVFTSLDPVVVGLIDDFGKAIAITVPAGTDVTSLVPTITASVKATVSPHSGIAKDFTNPVTYTVTAEDGSTQDYTVTVFVENGIPGAISTRVKDITDTSATIVGTNFPKNKEISFDVINYNSDTPDYTSHKTFTTDTSGIVLVQFSGLSPGGRYQYSHSEAPDEMGSFYTTGGSDKTDKTTDTTTTKNDNPGGLVPCTDKCGFNDLFTLINNAINFILKFLAVPLAAIMFAYAGFLLVTSGGSSEQMTKAKGIFINVALGLVFVAGAWLIVHTVLSIAGYNQSFNWFGL